MEKREIRFFCTHEGCNAAFSRADRFEIHRRQHTGERPFVCSFEGCFKSYIRSTHLTRHEATHSKGSFKCPHEECKAVLKTEATLKKHLTKHIKNKIYKCVECDIEFKHHRDLNAHNHRHTGVKPCKCPHAGCDKEFLYPTKLRRHMRVHEGYPCSYKDCDVVCANWNLYRKHQAVAHPDVYKCPTCSKDFSSCWNLRAHQKLHLTSNEQNVFLCTYPNCPRYYAEYRNLSYHMKICHILRPFACTEEKCSKSFKNEEQLQKHLETHDPNTPFSDKKRKKKLKLKKRVKQSFAAKLAGYKEKEEPISNANKSSEDALLTTIKKEMPSAVESLILPVDDAKFDASPNKIQNAYFSSTINEDFVDNSSGYASVKLVSV